MDLLERMTLVESLYPGSSREMCRRAGLRSETHWSALRKRLEVNPSARVSADILERVAEAVGVDPGWLAYGTGVPPAPAGGDPYPSRRAVLQRVIGVVDQRVIDHIASEVLATEVDPGPRWWLRHAVELDAAVGAGFFTLPESSRLRST